MSKLRVLLVQLPVPNNAATNVPLAAGYLKAYAQTQGLLDQVEIELLPRALADSAGDALLLEAIVARQPDLLGFSLYTWNSERSLDLAQRVKAQLPGVLVVVGGPEVQRDNAWVLRHPAVDVAVIGEGEQTFAELLRLLSPQPSAISPIALAAIPGVAFQDALGNLVFTAERTALADLSVVPSPYLLGYLEALAGGMLMVEVSRWCPYACSFCLYGRNMGPRLGNRYFGLERLLAEIRWGMERGATSIHFIEANLNLVPVFWPLMRALADLNANRQLALYAELRGEHISDEVADALVAAGLKVAEVGLQTANPVALRAARRRTDLQKWAAGTRRLLARGVEIYLDVILGLPADDAAGVAETLDFIQREGLGGYDLFTLQVLPGTAVRAEAEQHGLRFQPYPPYYVLATNTLPYAALRQLRRTLKHEVGLDPHEVEGCPAPHLDALSSAAAHRMWSEEYAPALHTDLVFDWADASGVVGSQPSALQVGHSGTNRRGAGFRLSSFVFRRWHSAFQSNPATLFDLYLLADVPPAPGELVAWRDTLPHQPGYLDRVAVYRGADPEPGYQRVSPRLFLVVPWVAQIAPEEYAHVAEIVWRCALLPGEESPLAAWAAAGGAGVWVRGARREDVQRWGMESGLRLWYE